MRRNMVRSSVDAAGAYFVRTDATDEAGQPAFSFEWREEGGPPVEAPTRKGFGSDWFSKVFPADFRGKFGSNIDQRALLLIDCTLER